MQQEKCILDPERDCLGLIKARELEKDFEDLRERNNTSHKEYYDRLAILEKNASVQAVQYNNILEKLDKLTADLEEIKAKPAKRWDGIVEKIIGVLVAAIVGFMLARIGL